MKYKVLFTEEARIDVKDSFDWYENKQKELGKRFIADIDKQLTYIIENPFSFKERTDHKRICPLKKFPFLIVYEVEHDQIVVYAIFHTSLNPR